MSVNFAVEVTAPVNASQPQEDPYGGLSAIYTMSQSKFQTSPSRSSSRGYTSLEEPNLLTDDLGEGNGPLLRGEEAPNCRTPGDESISMASIREDEEESREYMPNTSSHTLTMNFGCDGEADDEISFSSDDEARGKRHVGTRRKKQKEPCHLDEYTNNQTVHCMSGLTQASSAADRDSTYISSSLFKPDTVLFTRDLSPLSTEASKRKDFLGEDVFCPRDQMLCERPSTVPVHSVPVPPSSHSFAHFQPATSLSQLPDIKQSPLSDSMRAWLPSEDLSAETTFPIPYSSMASEDGQSTETAVEDVYSQDSAGHGKAGGRSGSPEFCKGEATEFMTRLNHLWERGISRQDGDVLVDEVYLRRTEHIPDECLQSTIRTRGKARSGAIFPRIKKKIDKLTGRNQ